MDIEELHRVVVQGFASLNDKFDSRFATVDAKFDAVDQRFEAIDSRFEAIDRRFDTIDRRFDALEAHMNTEFGRVKDALMEHGRQLKDIRAALDRKVDRDELEARR